MTPNDTAWNTIVEMLHAGEWDELFPEDSERPTKAEIAEAKEFFESYINAIKKQ